MARSNIKAVFENDVQTVWNVITDVKNYIWRTDLSKTEIISDKQFIEYTKNGYATTFTITLFEPYKRWYRASNDKPNFTIWLPASLI